MILPIYLYGSEVLRKKAKPVTKVDNKIIGQIRDMFETMREAQGVGLAANQVGSLARIIVVDVSEVEGYENVKPIALLNPEVIARSGEEAGDEGCLSIPEVRDKVTRPTAITVRFHDTNFELKEIEAHGFFARALMHEIDHINGILFLDYLSATERKVHAEQLELIKKGEIETDYPVTTTAGIPA